MSKCAVDRFAVLIQLTVYHLHIANYNVMQLCIGWYSSEHTGQKWLTSASAD